MCTGDKCYLRKKVGREEEMMGCGGEKKQIKTKSVMLLPDRTSTRLNSSHRR